MGGRASLPHRSVACSGCALAPLCEAAGPAPQGLPAVESRRRLAPGETLFAAGAPQSSVYAVHAGFLKIAAPAGSEGSHIVRFLIPGEASGLEAFAARRHACNAIALEDCEVCEIPLRRAQALCDAHPRVAAHVRSLLAEELARTQAYATTLACRSAPQRLAGFLADIARRWAERGFSGRAFRLPMERREIADYLGVTQETVSRLLALFRARGWVRVKGRQVEILALEPLENCPRAP